MWESVYIERKVNDYIPDNHCLVWRFFDRIEANFGIFVVLNRMIYYR